MGDGGVLTLGGSVPGEEWVVPKWYGDVRQGSGSGREVIPDRLGREELPDRLGPWVVVVLVARPVPPGLEGLYFCRFPPLPVTSWGGS